jgi:hypothetical protein
MSEPTPGTRLATVTHCGHGRRTVIRQLDQFFTPGDKSLKFPTHTLTALSLRSLLSPSFALACLIPSNRSASSCRIRPVLSLDLAHVVGRHLSDAWKRPVIVENKPGVNGT